MLLAELDTLDLTVPNSLNVRLPFPFIEFGGYRPNTLAYAMKQERRADYRKARKAKRKGPRTKRRV